jgi:hypothetical protein
MVKEMNNEKPEGRELVHIPMIHAMGVAHQEFDRYYAKALTEETREKLLVVKNEILPGFWKDVRGYLDIFHLDRVYPEGATQEDVDNLLNIAIASTMGDPTYTLVTDLMKQGVQLEHTHHDAFTDYLKTLDGDKPAHFPIFYSEEDKRKYNPDPEFLERAQNVRGREWIHKLRDWYAARQIDYTLQQGERGVLLFGRGHNMETALQQRVEKSGNPIALISFESRWYKQLENLDIMKGVKN